MTPALSPAERNRLVGILARLGSDFDGERASAALLAHRMLRAKGLGWDEVVAGRAVQPYRAPPRPPPGDDARADLELAARCSQHLNTWEAEFVASLSNRRHPPTPGQARKLGEIARRLRREGRA